MQKRVIVGVLFAFLFGLNIFAWKEVLEGNRFQLIFFDVGEGDAIFLETSQGHEILIDGGPDDTILSRLGRTMPFWDRTLDLVILTHPDSDHIAGLVEVLKKYKVEQVLWTGVEKDTSAFILFKQELEKEGAKETLAAVGQKIVWSKAPLEFIEVLYQGRGESTKKTNETSLIAKLVYHENTVLFSGDTVVRIEKLLVDNNVDLKADILKVAHHGSNTSSSREFLQAVNPEIAVISVGKDNRFSHPTTEVLARLQEYGIEIRRTDKEGNISFYFPSTNYQNE